MTTTWRDVKAHRELRRKQYRAYLRKTQQQTQPHTHMTPEIVTYERNADLKKVRQRQYARDYYRRNKKARQEYSRKYYARKRKKPEAAPAEFAPYHWYLVVPYSDSLLSNIGMLCRVAWRLLVTGPTNEDSYSA